MVSFFSAVVRIFGFSSTPTKWRVGTFHHGYGSNLGDYIEFNLKSGHLKCFNGTNPLQSADDQWDGLLLHFETHPKTVQLQASPLVWHFARARPCLDSATAAVTEV